MKIFNVTNGKEKVYVQMQDIISLMRLSREISIPASIINSIFNDVVIVDDSNKWSFVCFDQEDEVEFFKNINWIIDYKEHRDMSLDQLMDEHNSILVERNEKAVQFNSLSETERNNSDLYFECMALEYKAEALPDLFFVKRNNITMPFPNVVDSDGFNCGKNSTLTADTSIDPNKVIIKRNDDERISRSDVDRTFIRQAIVNGQLHIEETRGEYCRVKRAKYSLSDDGRSIVIQYTIVPILSKEEKNYEKEQGFVYKIINRLKGIK